jgi:hypothetical protein
MKTYIKNPFKIGFFHQEILILQNALIKLQKEAGSCFENTDSKILKVDVSSTVVRKTSGMR